MEDADVDAQYRTTKKEEYERGGQLPKAQSGKELTQQLFKKYFPKESLKYFRKFNPSNFDLRGLNNLDVNLLYNALPELNLVSSDFSDLTNYEIAALNNLQSSIPLDERFNQIVQNYNLIGHDDKITSLLGEYAANNPTSSFYLKGDNTPLQENLLRNSENIFSSNLDRDWETNL